MKKEEEEEEIQMKDESFKKTPSCYKTAVLFRWQMLNTRRENSSLEDEEVTFI